jgi:hypothetical protein
MTNREYLRNMLTVIAAELASIQPGDTTPAEGDIHVLAQSIKAAQDELDKLDADSIDEAYHVKALYDRIKAIVVNERIVRNTLDRVAMASQTCLAACNRISEQVEQDSPPEDDAL